MRFFTQIITIVLGLSALSGAAEKPYNVLFIIADDLTATAVSSYENKACKTPNIDKLAAEGARFTRAYCQFPVCGPSRASFMSGYYPHGSGTMGYVSGRKQIGDRLTWSQYFRQNGYKATRVSKIYHMGVPGDIVRGSNGSDDAASWDERFNSQGPEVMAPGDGERLERNLNGKAPYGKGNHLEYVMADGDDLVHSDGKTAEKASALLRARDKDKPFFLAVGFVRPHVPFVAPRDYYKPYPWQKAVLPPKVKGDWDDIPKAGINYKTSKNLQLNEEKEKKGIAAYYASVSYMDAQLGKVMKTLEEEGLEDNTIVIFTSDHGFHLCEHDFWMKVSLMEESVRVPLIIKVPGMKPVVSDSFAELVDLYPTVAELCGLQIPEKIQGKSLTKVLEDPKAKVRDAAFSVNGGSFLLRTNEWALIMHGRKGQKGIQLYDMQKDPGQFTNLAKDPAHQEVLKQMQAALETKIKEVQSSDIMLEKKK
ncbi:protein of unknown function [Rubritalea squalenifaciens DSM 18772]|uniref:Sulfatase N-terminal domain-containing protein n=1 Tax=Rubritalea squalenifaciens DSM 18772 TaxID=1123071 RepID=A0A1M6BGA5_9BACT|nr:sulfatase [Rubritalea squalenifaciens]SHI47735.1 protein of unknown function [Rubritalea squalenifaciens DSM 18772]